LIQIHFRPANMPFFLFPLFDENGRQALDQRTQPWSLCLGLRCSQREFGLTAKSPHSVFRLPSRQSNVRKM
jgi:hypothetical protein